MKTQGLHDDGIEIRQLLESGHIFNVHILDFLIEFFNLVRVQGQLVEYKDESGGNSVTKI